MTKFMPFVYDKHQFISNDKSFILTGQSLAYLTAFFNSSLFKFAFKDYFPELLGDSREMRKVFFETITVKEVESEYWYEEALENLIDQKQNGLSTREIELQIDERIFSLYELSASESSVILESIAAAGLSRESISALSSAEIE